VRDPVPATDVGLAYRKGVERTPEMEALRTYFRQAYQIAA